MKSELNVTHSKKWKAEVFGDHPNYMFVIRLRFLWIKCSGIPRRDEPQVSTYYWAIIFESHKEHNICIDSIPASHYGWKVYRRRVPLH